MNVARSVLTENYFSINMDNETTFPFFEDENGNGVYGFGHTDKSTFASLVNAYDDYFSSPPDYYSDDYTKENVHHRYAFLETYLDIDEWALVFCTESDEFASPITWIPR